MREQQIKEILLKKNFLYEENSTIWATILPNIGAYKQGLGETMYVMKDHILHFNSQGIVILPIDDMLGIPKEEYIKNIFYDEISEVRINIKWGKLRLCIKTNDGIVEYKIRKKNIGSPWHKENLANVLLMYTKGMY